MSRRVEWSPAARADFLDQITYLSASDAGGVDRIIDRIEATGEGLGDFATGHPGRVAGTYEKSVRSLPYILAYALTDADRCVTILRLIHTARDWRGDGWPE